MKLMHILVVIYLPLLVLNISTAGAQENVDRVCNGSISPLVQSDGYYLEQYAIRSGDDSWVATRTGELIYINWETNTYEVCSGLPNEGIVNSVLVTENKVWSGYDVGEGNPDSGVYVVNLEDGSVSQVISGPAIYDLSLVGDKLYAAGYQLCGIENDVLNCTAINEPIHSLYSNDDGLTLSGKRDVGWVHMYDSIRDPDRSYDFAVEGNVRDIESISEEQFLIAGDTETGSLSILNIETGTVTPVYTPIDHLISVAQQENILAVASWRGGYAIRRGSVWRTYDEQIGANSVWFAELPTEDTVLLVGTEQGLKIIPV
jgi:hypothetical protein